MNITKHQTQAINQGTAKFLAEWQQQKDQIAQIQETQSTTVNYLVALTEEVNTLRKNQQETVDVVTKLYQSTANNRSIDPNLQTLVYLAFFGLLIIGIATLGAVVSNLTTPVRYQQINRVY